MTNRILLFLLLFLALIPHCFGSDIEISAINFHEKIKPGNHYTFYFKITNNGNNSSSLKLKVLLPKAWAVIVKKEINKLDAKSSKTIFYSIRIPKRQIAGSQKIKISIEYGFDKVLVEKEFITTVEKVHDIKISTFSKPNFIIGDRSYDCLFLINNEGNSLEKLQFSSKNGQVDIETSVLKPGESVMITVSRMSKAGRLKKPTDIYSDLSVKNTANKVISTDFASVLVFPISTKQDPYLRYPIEVGVLANNILTANQKSNTIQYEIRGEGYVDKNNQHLIKFNLESPVVKELENFGTIQRRNIEYKNKTTSIEFGNYAVNLSLLTENSRSGSGIRINKKFPKLKAQVFYLRPKFFEDITNEYGGYLEFYPSQKWIIRSNWVTQSLSVTKTKNHLFSAVNTFAFSSFRISNEIALSTGSANSGYGTRLNLSYQSEKLIFNGRFLYSDKNFTGYLKNSLSYSTFLNYNISKVLKLNLVSTFNRNNASFDDLLITEAPLLNSYKGGLRYAFGSKSSNLINLSYTYKEKEDRLEPKNFFFKEQLANVKYHFKKKKLDVDIEGGFGKTTNLLIASGNNKATLIQSKLDVGYRLHNHINLRGSISYVNTSKYSENKETFWYFGLNAYVQHKDTFIFNFGYRSNYAVDELYKLKSFLNLEIEYIKKKNFTVSLESNYVALPESNEKQLFTFLKTTFKVTPPLYRKLIVGHLNGTLVSNSGNKIEGVLISFTNQISITDKQGDFKFSNITPGKHYLSIDPSSLDNGDITAKEGPFEIEIFPKSSTDTKIEIIRSGRIQGSINFVMNKQISAAIYVKKIPKVLIELKRGDESLLTYINKDEQFVFNNIRPGDWEISVYDSVLKKDFVIYKNYRKIYIEPGKTKKLEFKITEKKRKIQFSKKKVNLKID